ncbi:MAG TPA: T9SS type A sorting domain-containing protein [Flavilitoribacter sp.]|nr:T9SS type A sorting domain-containing protein [Flavilitoribacter sp.]HMQ89983.1 T9SS type A sorting domain-containing protein [Flavilitoribacter sp.]
MYVGCGRGLNAFIDSSKNEDDVWAYDFNTGEWAEKNPFPGGKIRNAAAFTLGEYGYIVTGHDGGNYQKLFWRYNPAADQWEKLPDFPGAARSHIVAFSIGDKGYVGLGGTQSAYFNDFYSYDPQTAEWSAVSSFPGLARWRAFAFVIDGQAYVGGGSHYEENTEDYTDCWRYDPQTDGWTFISSFPNDLVIGCFAFSLDSKGYVGEGAKNLFQDNYGTKIWEFDPQTKEWAIATEIIGPRTGRVFSYGTTHEGKAYVGGGSNYLLNWYFFDDFYSWDKNDLNGLEDFENWEALGVGQTDPNQTIIYDLAAKGKDTLWATPLSNLFSYTPSGANGFDAVGDTIWIPVDTRILKSTDRGESWTITPPGTFSHLIYSLAFENAYTGIFLTDNYPYEWATRAYRTDDGGESWYEIAVPEVPSAVSIEHIPGSGGGYIAHSTWIPSPKMIYTPDSGMHWFKIEAPPAMSSLQFIAPETGFGGGQLLPQFKSGVYKWQGNLDEITAIGDHIIGVADEDFSVFPNPGSTALSLYNMHNRFIKDVTIADLMGRDLKKMDILNNDKVNRIPLEGIRPGLYLLCVQTEGSAQHVIRFMKF